MNSGIYQIENTSNGKLYIGSTLNFTRRKYYHFYLLRKGCHPNKILQNSFTKYGESNFNFSILEICGKDKLIPREQCYLDELKPVLNIRFVAESNLGHRFIRTEEQREKYRTAHRNISSETRERMKQYKHTLGKKFSDKTKESMAEKKRISVIQCDRDMNPIKEWGSALEIEQKLGFNHGPISLCCNGKRKSAYKFCWKFKNNLI